MIIWHYWLVSSILDFVTNEIQSPIDKWQDLSNAIIEAIFRDSKEEESNGVSPMSNDKRMTLLTKSSLDWKFWVFSSASPSQQGAFIYSKGKVMVKADFEPENSGKILLTY